MIRRALLFVAPLALSCAQVLSYDDYHARPQKAPDPIDTGVANDAAPEVVVEDTAEAGEQPLRPPARPSGEAKPSVTGKTLWLAFKTYHLGTAEPTGGADENAWSMQGYDLDAICTSERDSIENLRTCRRPAGAEQDSLMDGDRCRDNNFGRFVGTIIRSAAPDTEKKLNDQMLAGAATWILRIDDVDEGSDDAYAPAIIYRASDERASTVKVKWDGTDVRSVHSDTVIDGDVERGVTTLPRGYIRGGTWVSGEPTLLDVSVPVSATLFVPMKLDGAVLTLDLASRKGTLAGALSVTGVEGVLGPIADSAGVCPGTPLYANMLSTIAKMPDVSYGVPGLQDTTSTCNGVSAGLSYEVVPIMPVTTVVAPPPPRNANCP